MSYMCVNIHYSALSMSAPFAFRKSALTVADSQILTVNHIIRSFSTGCGVSNPRATIVSLCRLDAYHLGDITRQGCTSTHISLPYQHPNVHLPFAAAITESALSLDTERQAPPESIVPQSRTNCFRHVASFASEVDLTLLKRWLVGSIVFFQRMLELRPGSDWFRWTL